MNPPPHERGGRSRYGPPPAQHAGQQQRYPFVVDPTEAAGAAVRAFFPAPGTREPPPPSPPSSSSAAERALVPTMQHGHHYGGGCAPEISLAAHGHAGQGHHGIHHRYHQFGVEGRQDGGGPSSAAASLQRHSTSPPGFFSSPVVDNGFPSTRAGVGGEVHNAMSGYDHQKKMKSPMNLSRQGTLSQFSENGIPDDLTNNVQGIGHSEESITANNMARSFSSGFSIGSWEGSNSIVFSNPASKSGIIHNNNDDIVASISNSYELQFGVGKETAGLLQMQEDQVPLRVRAKRGCATHPRSIAERERRTRISDKLRKLQALVPNMDKQTSTADMLDLAVDHIRGLQSELQALKEDKEKCTCRGNRSPGR